MVAVGSDRSQKAIEPTQVAATAATYELRVPGRSIGSWHVRADPKRREQFIEHVQEYMRTAKPHIPTFVLNGPPTLQRVASTFPNASKEAIAVAFTAAMIEYQGLNTALWDAIEPVLRFDGAYEAQDRLQKKEYMNNDLRDGVGLYNYVLELTSVNPIDRQIEALQALSLHGKLSGNANVTQVQFDTFLNKLLMLWTDVYKDSSAANVIDFRTRLIASMPDEPFSNKVVNVRLFLLDACNAGHEDTKTPQGLVRLATKRARELGLPAGSVLDVPIAAPLVGDSKDTKKTKKDDAKTPSVNEKSTRRPRAGENDCDYCILDLCKSKAWSKGKDAKKHCLVCSMCDPTKTIPHYPSSGSEGAPTKTELMALTVSQAALRMDPKIDLKKQTISYCRKLTSDKETGTKKPGEVATPLVSLAGLEMLMHEHGKEITDPEEFAAWAKSVGIDMACPLVGTRDETELATVLEEPVAVTPGYGWMENSPNPSERDASSSMAQQQLIAKQADDLLKMQEQLEQAQQQIQAQQTALRTAQFEPAPPAAPRTREPAEHMRSFLPMTPIQSSALAALHATPIVSSMGRSLAPVAEEPIATKTKGNLSIQSVSPSEAFARGMAYQAQAHAELERGASSSYKTSSSHARGCGRLRTYSSCRSICSKRLTWESAPYSLPHGRQTRSCCGVWRLSFSSTSSRCDLCHLRAARFAQLLDWL